MCVRSQEANRANAGKVNIQGVRTEPVAHPQHVLVAVN